MKLLHVDSSILGEHSASRQLSTSIVAALKKSQSSLEVIYQDLAAQPLGHLTGAEFGVLRGAEPQGEALKRDAARNAKLLEDFLAADIVVVGAPMYNFSLPSQLKAWLDRLAVAGKSFRYTESGVEGLAKGKRVIVASSRGGFHGEGRPTNFLDHQEKYLQGFFGFVGITDVTFIRAEGLGVGPEARKAAMDSAASVIEKLAA